MMELSEVLNGARTNAESLVRPLSAEADRDRPSVLEAASPLSIVGSSLLFSVLQSVCTAVVALNSVRLAIGIGSLAMTTGLGEAMEHFHQITWLRVTLTRGCPFRINIYARNCATGHPSAQSPGSPLASSSVEQQTEKNGTAAGFSFPRYTAACRDRGVLALQAVPHTLNDLPRI